MPTRLSISYLIVVFILLGGIVSATAQSDDCPALVQRALTSVGENCGGLARNAACYGFNQVAASFFQDVPEDFFSKPSDQTELAAVESITTAPLDDALEQWGIALLRVQANVPETMPGQAVVFVLLGDVQVDNAVTPEESQPVEPVTIQAAVNANIRSGPTTRANVVGSVRAGTELPADGISRDGGWLRITYNNGVAWISREVINPSDAVNALPQVAGAPRTPMQAFYLRTSVSDTACTEAPSLLVVQGPKQVQVDITANGADIRLGSTVAFQLTDKNTLRLLVVDGSAQTGGVVIPTGFTGEIPLDDQGNANGPFGGLRPINRQELAFLQTLENIPDNILNYPILVQDRPSVVPTQKPPDTSGGTTAPTSTPGGSLTPLPPGQVDCAPFQLTSPREGLAFGVNTFYWDPAPGATSYRVNVQGFASAETSAPNTSLTMDLYQAGVNFQMTITVDALVNGQVACTTPPITLLREAAPPPFTASWNCIGDNQFAVNYANVPPGDTSVVIQFSDEVGGPFSPGSGVSLPVPPYSGSQVFTGSYTMAMIYGAQVIAVPSGATINLGDLQCGSKRG